jgi:NIMA (never in mitosis gene a)-related kinase
MEFESIRDQKGKDHMVFNAQEFDNDESMGDKVEDFEPLQLLGEGSFGKVIKVSSLINQKIYAMKILNLGQAEGDLEKYFLSEIELLKKLDHPNIVKYYKSFREEDKLYIIMEYFDNGDLDDYIEVLKTDKKEKKENKKEEIWNIFYQSISGLNYLHSLGVVHRDIKPANIFMTKNKIIKIGDFGVSAIIEEKKGLAKIHTLKFTQVGTPLYMAPEILSAQAKYNANVDVFSMGCVFYKICCLKEYQKEDYVLENGKFKTTMVTEEIPANYGNEDVELMNIVSEMLNKNANERPNSEKILEKIKKNYNKVFIQNSGLYAVLSCMINLPHLRSHFLNKFKVSQASNKENKPYSDRFLFCIENAKNNWIENITFYRHKIIEENNFLNNNKEINPYLTFIFILDKIHGELNRVANSSQQKLIKKRSSFIDPIKEDKIRREYISNFSSNFNSNISNYFVGHMETIRQCCKCHIQTFIFTYFFSLDFDLNLPLLKQEGKSEIDLIDLFKMQNKISLHLKELKKLECTKCKKEVEHNESKIFYILPSQLVLSFDRGNNYDNKMKIKYPEKLDLSSIPKDGKYSAKLFDLVGVIKRCDLGAKEHYISLTFNYDEKIWYLQDNEKMEKIENQSDHKNGDVIMLFYVASKNK